MAFAKKNQIWKQVVKHGRDKLFTTPELLWEAAEQYFEWADANPWQKNEQNRALNTPKKDKDGNYIWPDHIIKIPTQRPYTLEGFRLFIGASESYWRNFKRNETLTDGFLTVIARIEDIIRNNQIEGGMVGAYNPNLTARLNGLSEKSELSGAGGEVLKIILQKDDGCMPLGYERKDN